MCTWCLSKRSQHRTAACLVTHDVSGVGFDDCKQNGTDGLLKRSEALNEESCQARKTGEQILDAIY